MFALLKHINHEADGASAVGIIKQTGQRKMAQITWTAKNNSSFLNGERTAETILGAVRAARRYLENELYGEGVIFYCEDGELVRHDEKSIHTGFRWEVTRY